jgi:hypothetical protein
MGKWLCIWDGKLKNSLMVPNLSSGTLERNHEFHLCRNNEFRGFGISKGKEISASSLRLESEVSSKRTT